MVVACLNGSGWNAHTDVADVRFHEGIVVGETDPLSARIPDMNMRPAAQCARCEGRSQVAGVEHRRLVWFRHVDDYTLAMADAILPVGRRILGPENKCHSLCYWIEGD